MKNDANRSFSWNSLGIKLFFSYLLIIALGCLVLFGVADLVAPNAFSSHVQMMQNGQMAQMMGSGGTFRLNPDLENAFNSSLAEALLIAGLSSVGIAVVVSFFVSRFIITPVSRLAVASKRIAQGHYAERIISPGGDELGAMATSFNQMAEALEATERHRLELIGDVAHELKTPITTLEGYMEGLLDGVVKPSEELWLSLHEEAGRLRRLVEDLQELSRAEAKQIPLRFSLLNPAEIAFATVERLESQFTDKGLEFTRDIPRDLPQVYADRDRTIQVLTNLLTNTLRYTPAHGIVNLKVGVEGNMVRFSVTDSGSGISSEHLPHLFERFYRVDKSRSRALGGSGIGLTIAKALVEAMGGQIQATSPGLGQGATFSFMLPRTG